MLRCFLVFLSYFPVTPPPITNVAVLMSVLSLRAQWSRRSCPFANYRLRKSLARFFWLEGGCAAHTNIDEDEPARLRRRLRYDL